MMTSKKSDTRYDTRYETRKARAKLYELIARFRKNAAETDDTNAQSTFETAADVLGGLVEAFRKYEVQAKCETPSTTDESEPPPSPTDDADPKDCTSC